MEETELFGRFVKILRDQGQYNSSKVVFLGKIVSVSPMCLDVCGTIQKANSLKMLLNGKYIDEDTKKEYVIDHNLHKDDEVLLISPDNGDTFIIMGKVGDV